MEPQRGLKVTTVRVTVDTLPFRLEVAQFPQRRTVALPAGRDCVLGVLDKQNAVDPGAQLRELGGLLLLVQVIPPRRGRGLELAALQRIGHRSGQAVDFLAKLLEGVAHHEGGADAFLFQPGIPLGDHGLSLLFKLCRLA